MPIAAASLITAVGEPFERQDVRLDDPIGREVLVEVRASGLCHSDLNFATNDYGLPLPILLGHEAAGVVVAVGPDVTEVAVGDHVVACSVPSCGVCRECRRGFAASCLDQAIAVRSPGQPPRISLDGQPVMQFSGIGGFAETLLIHESQIVTIDPALPFEQAALLGCGVVTGAGAVIRSAKVQPGDTVAVFGAGGVGLNSVQAAALVGAAEIIVVDLEPAKLELARRLGATRTVNPADGDTVEQVMAMTDGRGVDHAFEVIGALTTLEQATRVLGRRGTVYIVGMQRLGTELRYPVAAGSSKTLAWEQGIRGVYMGSTNFKVDIPYFASLALQGRYDLADLVSGTVGLDEVNEGYRRAASSARTLIAFDATTS